MDDPFDRPIVSPIMVGREGPLDALRRCVEAALAGQGQVVLVAGEAGIGKSRLVRETAAMARERGMRVLVAQCFEPDHALPYAPLRDLIRTNLLRQPWAEEILAEVAPDLGALLPELARLYTASVSASHAGTDQDRRRIVHAVLRLVDAIAARSPLLLIVEDAHWSDEASLDLLVQLARFLHGRNGNAGAVMLVVTYRGDEIAPPLAAALATLDRERLAVEARLWPLPRAEVIAMLQAMSHRRRGLKWPNFSDASEQAIEAREIATIQIEQRRQEALVAEQEAARLRNQAQGDAAFIRAQGEAKSLAETGRAVRENPEILELERIRALTSANVVYVPSDGILPVLDLTAESREPNTTPTPGAAAEPTPTPAP